MPTPSRELHIALSDLGSFINNELAATQMAIGALRTLAHRVNSEVANSPDPTGPFVIGTDVPEVGWIMRISGAHGAQELAREVGQEGPMVRRLTRQWIVAVYTAWEDEFRGAIARAHDVDKNSVTAPFFGDLRWLRHDIAHHRGVATKENATRCRVILDRDLRPGDEIYLRDDELRQIPFRIPWSTLQKRPAGDP